MTSVGTLKKNTGVGESHRLITGDQLTLAHWGTHFWDPRDLTALWLSRSKKQWDILNHISCINPKNKPWFRSLWYFCTICRLSVSIPLGFFPIWVSLVAHTLWENPDPIVAVRGDSWPETMSFPQSNSWKVHIVIKMSYSLKPRINIQLFTAA